MKVVVAFYLLLLNSIAVEVFAVEVQGLLQVNYVLADEKPSWFEKDTGILAYSKSGVNVQQAILNVSDSASNGFSYNVVGNYYQLGKQHWGISQAQIGYKPLSQNIVRWRARAGFFYPKMSLENVDLGWVSPFTYTQSAINSWIGEELRAPALELTLYSPGRARKSAFSWELRAAAFKGDDPLGTLISWRGFAMHDRQSLNNDRVSFAAYPTVVAEEQIFHPNYVEPFHEIDTHVGFYLGLHMDYYRQTKLRYYYYDNQADPLSISEERLYGWRTKFHSLAIQHKFTQSTRILSQWMSGSTTMGANRAVYVNFDAWYLMLSHQMKQHRVSLRFDSFKVREDDIMPQDQNNSDGNGVTLAWRYNLDKHWQVGLEHHFNENSAENRASLNQVVEINQQQSMAVLQYRW